MQELVWLVGNKLDYETSFNISLNERVPFLSMLFLIYLKSVPRLIVNKNEMSLLIWIVKFYIILFGRL